MSFNLDIINQYILHKQHLANNSKSNDILEVVKDIFGLHATDPSASYLSLFARMNNFSKHDLERELYTKKSLAKIRCIRKTIFIIPIEILPTVLAATSDMVSHLGKRHYQYLGLTQKQYTTISKKVQKLLLDKSMTANEIKKSLDLSTSTSPILSLMCDQGLLVRGRSERLEKQCPYLPSV